MAASGNIKSDFGLPDLASLSESEKIQVLAVMQKAKEFDMKEDAKSKTWRPMEGQLTKFTNVMKGWLHRWFILDPESGMLEYFEKEEHKKQRPRGSIHLAAAVISPSEEDSQTFVVSAANGEVYKLRASDAKERQQWVDRLRATSEHHTSYMAQKKRKPKTGLLMILHDKLNVPAVHREVRSSSTTMVQSGSSTSVASQRQKKGSHGSNENINQTTPRSAAVTKAPMAHPHTIDPFKEVKEYMMEAEDYSASLTERISALPQTGQQINSLDTDMLLIRATTSATLQCLGQCLTMLQQRQNPQNDHSLKKMMKKKEAYGVLPSVHSVTSASVDISPRLDTRTCSIADSIPSPTGSFTSAADLPFILPESSLPEGPINHEEELEDEGEYKDKDLEGMEEHKSIILHLLSQLKLGMDLTKVVLPTFILERRSLLELFADCMAHPDVFLKITSLPDPEDRMMGVLEWYLTSFHAGRQGSIAKKPYNPIIGETFHCSWKIPPKQEGSKGDQGEPCLMTYTAEQVSHHPPVSAFYFECPMHNVCINASIYTKSKFMGMSIGVVMVGKVVLKLLDFDEEYVFSLPSAYARSILTTPWVELGDKIQMTCQKTNMNASVVFHTKPFYGGKLHRVTAEVKNGNTGSICCKVQGEWNSHFEFTYANGETKVINVHDNHIWRKRVRPVEKQGDFESRKLWQHVTNALRVGDINTATEHKKFLEERQREGERHRKDTNTHFPTKYFKKIGDTWMYKDMLQKKQKS
ncbi:oxysterol-binding protein-related protein 11-like isoform X3 [Mercenaria mercenaria]|uniref:oxysterol-binding protein-related protein 11-like isoform X3 n=1 Tax=Mercenaria mercenaria TaxID=6596 RepID=UPI00234E8A00|nr:oxysterol-binding protein-related protein 11-like isoform X3 [Mercenaria mercenaria]